MASMEVDSANSNASDPDNPRFSVNGMLLSIAVVSFIDLEKLFEFFRVLNCVWCVYFAHFISFG